MSVALYFVTGGTSGIGRECVLELLRCNHRVVAVGLNRRHADELAALASTLSSGTLQIAVGDLTDPRIAAGIARQGPQEPVSGLINAAGIVSAGGIETEPLQS